MESSEPRRKQRALVGVALAGSGLGFGLAVGVLAAGFGDRVARGMDGWIQAALIGLVVVSGLALAVLVWLAVTLRAGTPGSAEADPRTPAVEVPRPATPPALPTPAELERQPSWLPEAAAGAAWTTAGEAAAGAAPAAGWGSGSAGWQPNPGHGSVTESADPGWPVKPAGPNPPE